MKYDSIAIAGLPKSGKTALIEELLKVLPNWKNHSIGGLIRDNHKIWQEQNKKQISFEDYFATIFSDNEILKVNSTAEKLLQEGKIILDSRFAFVNSQNSKKTLLIFLTCPIKTRAERAKKSYHEKSTNEVEEILNMREKEERKRGLELYSFDYTDLSIYDKNNALVLDSSKMTIAEEVREVLNYLIQDKKLIVVSGLPGAGSSSLAKEISKRTGLNYFSVGQMYKDTAKGNLHKQYYFPEFKKICEEKEIKIPTMNEEDDSSATLNFWKNEVGNSAKFHQALDELQINLSKKGNLILEGKLAIRMIRNADLKIWLKASLEKRAERISQRDNHTTEESKDILVQREKRESEGWNKIYGFYYLEQEKEADLVIDSTNLSQDEIFEIFLSRVFPKK